MSKTSNPMLCNVLQTLCTRLSETKSLVTETMIFLRFLVFTQFIYSVVKIETLYFWKRLRIALIVHQFPTLFHPIHTSPCFFFKTVQEMQLQVNVI